MSEAAIANRGRPAGNPACGTEQGYQRHRYHWRKHGTGPWPLPLDDPCGCRAAHREHYYEVAEAERRRDSRDKATRLRERRDYRAWRNHNLTEEEARFDGVFVRRGMVWIGVAS